ncbi:MAG: exodeoxyribonuclease VII large subunit, partial [Candidatus Omnitrophota bacterium]
YVLRAPMNVFLQLQQQLDDLAKSVQANIAHCVEIKSKEFAGTAGKLEMLSPLAVLERGYSITFKGEKTVKTAAGLKAGDALRTRLARGEVFSTVKRIEKERAGGKG